MNVQRTIVPPCEPARSSDWGSAARRDLLEQITDFLLRHDLAVSVPNLAAAHAILSGSALDLARVVCERELNGQPITQEWLDTQRGDCAHPDPDRASVERMMDQIEAAIAGFASTTTTAKNETGAMHNEMRNHIDAAHKSEIGASDILHLSTAVLDTLKRIQDTMQTSQERTRELQAQLDKARVAANSDHLTGLPNRRAFEQTLTRFHKQASSDDGALFVAICDVDHFKRINDSFGHETGDRMLRAIAGVLQRFASEDCFVARHGGEEFVVLIRGADAGEALAKVEAARKELANRKFVARRTKQAIGQVTFSAGLADVFATDNPRDALAAADDALYRAKEQGRNRVLQA